MTTIVAVQALAAITLLLVTVHLWSRLRRARTDLAQARWSSEHDLLTGLPNRMAAQRHFIQRFAAQQRQALILLDLDDFKTVNDTWGHQAGDTQLVTVAHRLAAATLPTGGLAARLAGDEFLLLVPATDPRSIVSLASDILARLNQPVDLSVDDGRPAIVTTTASAGIALPGPASTWANLMQSADIALYQAKREKGHAALYTAGMRHPSHDAPRSARLREQRPEQWRLASPEPSAQMST